MKQIFIFTTPTCLPCGQMKAQLTGFNSNIKYMDMENDKAAQGLAHKYAVCKAPTTIFMIDDIPCDSVSGYSQTVIRKIKEFLND